jgi:NADH dehydrogenase/NADH:ubiquinone oxidoreductase subunit G
MAKEGIMADQITLTINEVETTVAAGTTILKAAEQLGIIDIPTMCYHEACTANGLCRICVVEVEGSRTLVPSCCTPAANGMKVQTRTPRVDRARRTILEMLATSVDLSDAPEIEQMIIEYSADPERFPGAQARRYPVLDDNPMYIRDYSKCILCWRCVQVCAEDAQYTYAINFSGRGYETRINTFFEIPLLSTTCVVCGQCVGVCPTGALKPKREWLLEQGKPMQEIIGLTKNNRPGKKRSTSKG